LRARSCSWVGKFSIIKMLIVLKLINSLPIITTGRISIGMNESIWEFIWNGKGTGRIKIILKKKNKVEGFHLFCFKTYQIVTVINSIWYWWRDRHTDQWNKTQNRKVDPQNGPNWFFSSTDVWQRCTSKWTRGMISCQLMVLEQ
jgi:hypothetical protein